MRESVLVYLLGIHRIGDTWVRGLRMSSSATIDMLSLSISARLADNDSSPAGFADSIAPAQHDLKGCAGS